MRNVLNSNRPEMNQKTAEKYLVAVTCPEARAGDSVIFAIKLDRIYPLACQIQWYSTNMHVALSACLTAEVQS